MTDVELGRVGPVHWRFCLVPEGMAQLFVKKAGERCLTDLGSQAAGFVMTLTLGDAVYVQRAGRPKLMFRLVGRQKRSMLQYGEGWGPYPGQYRELDKLPESVFANAGLGPAEHEEVA